MHDDVRVGVRRSPGVQGRVRGVRLRRGRDIMRQGGAATVLRLLRRSLLSLIAGVHFREHVGHIDAEVVCRAGYACLDGECVSAR